VWLVLVDLLGSVTSSDSGHSTQLDSHSNSSVEVAAGPNQGGCSPPSQHRRHSIIQGKASPQIRCNNVGCMCGLVALFPMRGGDVVLLALQLELNVYVHKKLFL
jgi:hypothetical protein